MNSRTQSKRRQNKTSTRVIQPLVHYTKYIGENYTKIDYTKTISMCVFIIYSTCYAYIINCSTNMLPSVQSMKTILKTGYPRNATCMLKGYTKKLKECRCYLIRNRKDVFVQIVEEFAA